MEVPHLSEEAAAAAARASRSPFGACGGSAAAPEEGPDAHWAPDSLPPLPAHAAELFEGSPVARSDYSSRLLTLRDGTRVALDVHLPCGESAAGGAPFNVVFVQSRYGRAWRLRWPYNRLWGRRPVDIVYFLFKARPRSALRGPQHAPRTRETRAVVASWRVASRTALTPHRAQSAWLAAGLAVVTLDIRGCGASFGTWSTPWCVAASSLVTRSCPSDVASAQERRGARRQPGGA
jgi:hypothetical protein